LRVDGLYKSTYTLFYPFNWRLCPRPSGETEEEKGMGSWREKGGNEEGRERKDGDLLPATKALDWDRGIRS